MSLDPMKPATDLDATQEELTPREKQNRDGRRYNMIPDVGNSGFLSVLATTTPVKFTPTQWFEIKAYLETGTNPGITLTPSNRPTHAGGFYGKSRKKTDFTIDEINRDRYIVYINHKIKNPAGHGDRRGVNITPP